MQHQDDKDEFTPMPEENEENIGTFSYEPSTKPLSQNERRQDRHQKGPEGFLDVSARNAEQNVESKETSEYEEEGTPVGAVVGAVIIIGTLIAGGLYLYYESNYGIGGGMQGTSQTTSAAGTPKAGALDTKKTPPPPPPPISSVMSAQELLASPTAAMGSIDGK